MTGRRRLVTLAAIAVLALSACSSRDAKISDVVDAVDEAGLNSEQARCVGQGFRDADFSQETLNKIADAETPDDFPANTGDRIDRILEECTTGSSTTSTTEGSGEPSGSSTTSTTAG
jgi:hypothetical protein